MLFAKFFAKIPLYLERMKSFYEVEKKASPYRSLPMSGLLFPGVRRRVLMRIQPITEKRHLPALVRHAWKKHTAFLSPKYKMIVW